ncbi:hypothetical protein Q5752_000984 [Cryptotrichosporon argae]
MAEADHELVDMPRTREASIEHGTYAAELDATSTPTKPAADTTNNVAEETGATHGEAGTSHDHEGEKENINSTESGGSDEAAGDKASAGDKVKAAAKDAVGGVKKVLSSAGSPKSTPDAKPAAKTAVPAARKPLVPASLPRVGNIDTPHPEQHDDGHKDDGCPAVHDAGGRGKDARHSVPEQLSRVGDYQARGACSTSEQR